MFVCLFFFVFCFVLFSFFLFISSDSYHKRMFLESLNIPVGFFVLFCFVFVFVFAFIFVFVCFCFVLFCFVLFCFVFNYQVHLKVALKSMHVVYGTIDVMRQNCRPPTEYTNAKLTYTMVHCTVQSSVSVHVNKLPYL